MTAAARVVEQADGVAVQEVERPYCLIVCADGGGRRAGQVMSLSVLGHVCLPTLEWLHIVRGSSQLVKRRWSVLQGSGS